MASTHTWHTGSYALKPEWPVPTALLPDEILSSWLVRTALRQGCDPLALTGDLWPKWRPWTMDIDRNLPSDCLDTLSRHAGMDPTAIQSATLVPIATQIRGRAPPKRSIWPWILALGARNTKRRSGLQYCPQCLSEDETPYFRVQWRFVWHTGCEKHGCSLVDRCWRCHAPLEPHRLGAQAPHVARCPSCEGNLSDAPKHDCLPDALAFQAAGDQVLLGGQGLQFGHLLSVDEWFETAEFFISLVRRSGRNRTDAQITLCELMGLGTPSGAPAIPGATIEFLSVRDRHEILGFTWRFLEAERGRLLNAILESGISYQGLVDKGQRIPESIHDLIAVAPDASRSSRRSSPTKRSGPRPRHEVERMMARLERKLEMKRR